MYLMFCVLYVFTCHCVTESEDEGADTEFEELKELLEEIEAEEPPEEEEEDEEAEEDARERMHTALYEKFDEQTEALSALQVWDYSGRVYCIYNVHEICSDWQ